MGKHSLNVPPPGSAFEYSSDSSDTMVANVNRLWNVNVNSASGNASQEYEGRVLLEYSKWSMHHAAVRVSKKVLADMMEAVLGCFFIAGCKLGGRAQGISTGETVMKAIGAWPVLPAIPKAENECMKDTQEQPTLNHISEKQVSNALYYPSVPTEPVIPLGYPLALERIALGSNRTSEPESDPADGKRISPTCIPRQIPISRALSRHTVDALAAKLGYRFQDFNLLDEALTHCSCQHKASNQRLEFLGDAVLDFAVVCMLYDNQNWAKQGDLSSQKSFATNNKRLGSVALRLGLHKYLQVMSSQLLSDFSELASTCETVEAEELDKENVAEDVDAMQGMGPARVDDEDQDHECSVQQDQLVSASAEDNIELDMRRIELCKPSVAGALADLMEALFGAAYIDSNGSLDAVCHIVTTIGLLPQLSS